MVNNNMTELEKIRLKKSTVLARGVTVAETELIYFFVN